MGDDGDHRSRWLRPLTRNRLMNIALTGGTGFLGRYLIRHLAELGHRLRCWYRPTSDRGGLDDVASAVTWLPGQLGDPGATTELVRGADAVVHAAVEWE